MHSSATAANQLSYILAKPIKPTYCTQLTKRSVENCIPTLDFESFIPFVKERDNLGRLLPSLTERSLPRVKQRNKSVQYNSNTRRSSLAFNSSTNKTYSRRHIQIYPSPPIGHYQVTPPLNHNSLSTAIDHQSTGRLKPGHKKALSVDFLNYDRLYSVKEKHVIGFNMRNQLAREKFENDFEQERKELYRPQLKLPDHLKKYKGLYHVSDFKPEEGYVIEKDAEDIKERQTTIKATLRSLKDFGKEITKNLFKPKQTG